jgi:hypothetical protein
MRHRTLEELEAEVGHVRAAPQEAGKIEHLVRRPQPFEREVVQELTFSVRDGVVGDCWSTKPSSKTPDGSPHKGKQVTLMNARVIALIAGEREHWSVSGDQIHVDLDLSKRNLPVGTRLRVGTAILEVSDAPHIGSEKFQERFGKDALRFLSTKEGLERRMRGMNCFVLHGGTVRKGEAIRVMRVVT